MKPTRGRQPAICALVLFMGLVPAAFGPPATADEPGREIRLQWALGAVEPGSENAAGLVKDTKLPRGTRLKFMLQPLSAASLYLIYLDARNSIEVLHRESTADATQNARTRSYIPPGEHWFQLEDPSGLETFFLLASEEPLVKLEQLLDQLAAAEPDARPEIARAIVKEIRTLNKQHRQFQSAAEKPALIGGQVKGEVQAAAVDHLAIDVTARGFYGKTITIEH